MASWFDGAPFWIAFAALFGIVCVRAQATYWAGRGLTAGARRTRLADRIDNPRTTRVTDALNRWGAPLVTLSFLTIGFQTAINAAAGITRMRWPRYTLAMVPGCLAWAAIYATVGLAAAQAWIALAARSAGHPGCCWPFCSPGPATVLIVRRRAAAAQVRG